MLKLSYILFSFIVLKIALIHWVFLFEQQIDNKTFFFNTRFSLKNIVAKTINKKKNSFRNFIKDKTSCTQTTV